MGYIKMNYEMDLPHACVMREQLHEVEAKLDEPFGRFSPLGSLKFSLDAWADSFAAANEETTHG